MMGALSPRLTILAPGATSGCESFRLSPAQAQLSQQATNDGDALAKATDLGVWGDLRL